MNNDKAKEVFFLVSGGWVFTLVGLIAIVTLATACTSNKRSDENITEIVTVVK